MTLKHRTLFIVDDEPTNLRLLNKILTQHGYTSIEMIQDPREVIPKYQALKPDLILLDLNMPHLDGFQVISALKALNDDLLPPIIVLTALQRHEALLQALEAGARDYLTKPFERQELLMRVNNLLEAHLAHRMMHNQKQVLEEVISETSAELLKTKREIVRRLGMAAEYKDEETGNHILRMSHVSAYICKAIGLSDGECDLMLNASPMHDIGKIGIPDAVLLKPGKLTADEWEIMKTHTTIGEKMLSGDDSTLLKKAKEIAYTHHEKWDGSGYPNGLKAQEIPLFGRIVAIADVFDALSSERPYKKAWSVDDSANYIKENAGIHFDPRLVETFLKELPEIIKISNQFRDS